MKRNEASAWTFQQVGVGLGILILVLFGNGHSVYSEGMQDAILVQAPYEFHAPPRPQIAPDTSIPPNTKELGVEEVKRAEALLPLLAGEQELYAIGEFVHLGRPGVPVLIKALKMQDPRLRYNAIETLKIINDPSAAPALVESAIEPLEMTRVRGHALKVAVLLDPTATIDAIRVMAKDENDSIRKAAAFEGRYVRDKRVVPILIELITDTERFVGVTAVHSLWKLTKHETEMHDWASSSHEQRKEWGREWVEWWELEKDTFVIPEPKVSKKSS